MNTCTIRKTFRTRDKIVPFKSRERMHLEFVTADRDKELGTTVLLIINKPEPGNLYLHNVILKMSENRYHFLPLSPLAS